MSFKAGDTVGEYRILGPIATGGMGEVFRAEHVLTRRVEAVKILNASGWCTEAEAQRFLREIQLQASLTHPHIASVYHAFRAGDDLVMAMELVEGEPLRAWLERGRLNLPAALDYARQTLEAIGYAHTHGVVHRDISPSNIIITRQGSVKLTDFGLAKVPAAPSASQSGAPMGSPWYMSPEQVKDASQASARSDIYSLGAVLYEMVTGRKVFEGASAFLIMQAQVDHAPVPPASLVPGLAPGLNAAILTALEKDPQRRFASADAFRLALEQAVRPVAARPGWRHRFFGSPVVQFSLTCGSILLAMSLATRRPATFSPSPRVPATQAAPAPAAVEPAPAAATPEVPAEDHAVAEQPRPRPPIRRTRSPVKQRDLTPRVTGLVSAPAPAEAVRPADPTPQPALEARSPAQPEVSPVATPEAPAAAAATPAAPEKENGSVDDVEKKPRNRVWRALGRILSPLHRQKVKESGAKESGSPM